MVLFEPKGPDEVIYYGFDWATKRLEPGEQITDFGFEISGGSVEIASAPPPSESDGVCRVHVQGGEIGDVCILTSWVETTLNPRRDFSGKLKVKEK